MAKTPTMSAHGKPPHLLWWSIGCFMLNFAINATINKYGSHWPDSVIVLLWILPIIPFAIWAFLHERTLVSRTWLSSKFRGHPVSISIIFLVFLWIAFSQTARIVHHFQNPNGVKSTQPPATAPILQANPRPTSGPIVPPPSNLKPFGEPLVRPKQNALPSVPVGTPPILAQPIVPTQTVNVDHGIGGIGGTYVNPTVNNFGPLQREITKSIGGELIAVLKQHPTTAHIYSDSGDDDANQLAQQLFDIFVASDWKPISIVQLIGQALPKEVQLCYYGPPGIEGQRVIIPADRPEIQAVAIALINSGVKHVTVVQGLQYEEHSITINIGRRVE